MAEFTNKTQITCKNELSRLNSGNTCYHSVLLFTLRNMKIKVHRTATIILPVVLCGCETWSLTSREEHRLKVYFYYKKHFCDIAHLRQQCHNSKSVIFQEKLSKFRSAVIFYECNDDTTVLQRRVL